MPDELQAALPREMYVDAGHLARSSATPCSSASGSASAGVDDLGLAEPARVVVVDVAGESVLVTSDEDGALHAAYNVCRHRGSQLLPVPDAARARAARPRCAAPTTPGPTPSTAACCRAPHAERRGRRRVRAAPGRRRDLGRLRLRAPDAGRAPSRWPTQVAHAGAHAGQLRARRPGDRRRCSRYDVAANYKVLLENYNECYHCGPVHPELSPAGAVVRRRRRRTSTGTQGIPHREGAWTFTMTGTTTARRCPGSTSDERTRHKGDLVYPNLMLSASADHVAAFVLQPAGRRPHRRSSARCCSRRRGGRGPGFDPSDAARAVGPGQPAGLGDLRVGAARDVVAQLHARLVRADGGRQPRHPPLAAAPARRPRGARA